MAMVRYSRGTKKLFLSSKRTVALRSKMLLGAIRHYPVFRPLVDHSVYREDNRRLGCTFRKRAKIIHSISWPARIPNNIPPGALIEFEHPFALVGHLDEQTDYVSFRQNLHSLLQNFLAWFHHGQHRLIGCTNGAVRSLLALFHDSYSQYLSESVELLRWGIPKYRHRITPPKNKLNVFHYGGPYPYAKGTHDVLAAARRLLSVDFHVVADLTHPLFRTPPPVNVRLYPFENKRQYDLALFQSHLLIYPIYADGWGVILDALSAALPIIIYDSYDKDEAVIHDKTGMLVRLPKQLSFYDDFARGEYRNWTEYNTMIADCFSQERANTLASFVENYARDKNMLIEHSWQTSLLHDRHHDPRRRIHRIHQIYENIIRYLDGELTPTASLSSGS
ncbi:MAG: glycosyltransferase [Pseudomonadota bacterium]